MFELCLLCPEERVEILSDALDALDALSVSVEDADAQTPAEQALFGEPGMPAPKDGWQRSRMVALFAQEALAKEASDLLTAQDFFEGCQVLGVRKVEEQDWVRLTQSQFDPVEITPTFWIVPSWHEPPAQARARPDDDDIVDVTPIDARPRSVFGDLDEAALSSVGSAAAVGTTLTRGMPGDVSHIRVASATAARKSMPAASAVS